MGTKARRAQSVRDDTALGRDSIEGEAIVEAEPPPLRKALDAIYRADAEANCIELGDAPVSVRHDRGIFLGHGRATLRLQPRFTLSIKAEFASLAVETHIALSQTPIIDFSYGSNFAAGKALITELNLQGDEKSTRTYAELMPNPQRMAYGEPHRKLARLLCHIVNFPTFLSIDSSYADTEFKTPNGGWRLLGRVVLSDPPWQIELQETPEAKAAAEELKQTAGYGITHVAQLTQQGDASFTVKEAEAVIQNLYLFLSFARGAWTPPVLSVGFDEAGKRLCEDWGVRIATPWEVQRSWFDRNHGESLNALYQGFCSLLHDADLGKAVSSALYWYLRSNRGGGGAGIDSGVILSQAALERLSSAYLDAVRVRMPGRTKAADYLREALSRLQIPLVIPSSLLALTEGQLKGHWKDGPEATTRIRNELVHPRSKSSFKVGAVVPNAWNLSQWYIELMILRLAGYNGEYSNRLRGRWVGEIESVPWKTAIA